MVDVDLTDTGAIRNKLRVLLADDHPIVRGGLKSLVETQPDMEVVGEAHDGREAVRMALEMRPDVAVIDVSMPGVGGAEATQQIVHATSEVKVLALTALEEKSYARLLLQAGATGYMLKRAAADDLIRAIRSVASGGTYLDPTIAGQIVSPPNKSRGHSGVMADLSDREAEVVKMIAQGYALKQIAAKLDISVRTAETYKARAMEKLEIKSRAGLVRYALERGWLNSSN